MERITNYSKEGLKLCDIIMLFIYHIFIALVIEMRKDVYKKTS